MSSSRLDFLQVSCWVALRYLLVNEWRMKSRSCWQTGGKKAKQKSQNNNNNKKADQENRTVAALRLLFMGKNPKLDQCITWVHVNVAEALRAPNWKRIKFGWGQNAFPHPYLATDHLGKEAGWADLQYLLLGKGKPSLILILCLLKYAWPYLRSVADKWRDRYGSRATKHSCHLLMK